MQDFYIQAVDHVGGDIICYRFTTPHIARREFFCDAEAGRRTSVTLYRKDALFGVIVASYNGGDPSEAWCNIPEEPT